VPKTSSSDVTGVAPSGLGVCCLEAWGALSSDKGKSEKLETPVTWQKM